MRSRRFVIGAIVAGLSTIPAYAAVPLFLYSNATLLLGVGVAIGTSVLVGSLVGRRFGAGRVPLIAGIGALAFAVLIAPLFYSAWWAIRANEYLDAEAAYAARSHEPIVTTDEFGLCEPPVFSLRKNIPSARIAVRVPFRDEYHIGFVALDARGERTSVYRDTLLDTGLHRIEIKGRKRARSPLTVEEVGIESNTYEPSPVCRCEHPCWRDVRKVELAVVSAP